MSIWKNGILIIGEYVIGQKRQNFYSMSLFIFREEWQINMPWGIKDGIYNIFRLKPANHLAHGYI